MQLPLENSSDKELIKQAKLGDQSSLDALVRQYLPIVYGIARRYIRDSDDLEDATQEVFIKMWRNLKKFDARKPVKPWLAEITKNTCLDILKKKKALSFSAFEAEDGTNALLDNIPSTTPLPTELVDQSIFKKILHAAIKKISPNYAEVLSLYYYKGLNFREIAEVRRESIDTIKSRHRRAIILLRGLLDETSY